jgi:nucleoside-diphosphate-sugar epimerase
MEFDLLAPDRWPVDRIRQCSAVIHLAAAVHDTATRADEDTLHRMNVAATSRLLGLTPGRPFVFASTFAVFRPNDAEWIDEDLPLGPITAYGRAKLAAERDVIAAGGTVLRFPVCYGPRDRGNIARLIRQIQRGLWLFPGVPGAYRPLLGSANAAAALWSAVDTPAARGATLVVADDEGTTLRVLVETISALAGVRPPWIALPAWSWVAAARVVGAAERVAPSLPLPRATAVDNLRRSVRVRLDRARAVLGSLGTTTLADGLTAQFEETRG